MSDSSMSEYTQASSASIAPGLRRLQIPPHHISHSDSDGFPIDHTPTIPNPPNPSSTSAYLYGPGPISPGTIEPGQFLLISSFLPFVILPKIVIFDPSLHPISLAKKNMTPGLQLTSPQISIRWIISLWRWMSPSFAKSCPCLAKSSPWVAKSSYSVTSWMFWSGESLFICSTNR